MIIGLVSQFHVFLLTPVKHSVLNSVLNVKVVVGAFNQEKALAASRGLPHDDEASSSSVC